MTGAANRARTLGASMTPTPTDAELIERLRKQRQLYNGLGTFRDELWNPDGPEAADRLTSLSAQIEELRAALEQWKCPSCQGHARGYACLVNDAPTRLPCSTCEQTGLHPVARTTLGAQT